MGQTVYVLMELSGGKKTQEWRPVAVVSDLSVAEQWQSYGKNVDWVPLELDDTHYLQPGEKAPEFHPQQITPIEQRAMDTAKEMEQTNERLLKIIDRLQKQLGVRGKVDREQRAVKAPTSALLKKAEEVIPPKPVERIKGGMQAFPEKLDAQEIADFVETYSTYPVDNEFIYEMYSGSHAELKLVPVAELTEGGRDHNQQSPKNEAKYEKMNLKTMPPLLVENGEVKDGNHRLRASQKRGLTHMWCYVVTGGDIPEEEPDVDIDTDSSQES